MKKIMFVAAMAISAAAFTGCGNSTPKADLKSDVDTLSYAIGMAQTQGLKEYLVGLTQLIWLTSSRVLTRVQMQVTTRSRLLTMLVSRLVSRSAHV